LTAFDQKLVYDQKTLFKNFNITKEIQANASYRNYVSIEKYYAGNY